MSLYLATIMTPELAEFLACVLVLFLAVGLVGYIVQKVSK